MWQRLGQRGLASSRTDAPRLSLESRRPAPLTGRRAFSMSGETARKVERRLSRVMRGGNLNLFPVAGSARDYGIVAQTDPSEPSKRPEEIHLVGGVNFSTWPDLKWARGNTHAKALEANYVEWLASAPVGVKAVLRDDRQGVNFVARVQSAAPTHEWSLLLGDALHNFRSSFDALAWGLAHVSKKGPSKPQSVKFPICVDEGKWDEAVKAWIGELDPEFQHRLKVMQPFTFEAPGSLFLLKMLHDLDIQDKHKDILTVSAALDSFNLDAGSFEYENDEENAEVMPRVRLYDDVKLEDGAVLGTLDAGATIKTLGDMILRPTMRVQLAWDGHTFDVGSMLPQIASETRRCLDILMHGLDSPDEDQGEWAPMDVSPSPK